MALNMSSGKWLPFYLRLNVLNRVVSVVKFSPKCSQQQLQLNHTAVLKTRTTRTPVFWGYPPPPHDYPYHWVILDPKPKEDKVSHNFKKSPKFHATHLLKLLDKMCKYEMDPMSILEDTERTRFCPQTDRRTDERTDRRTDGQGDTSIPPLSTSLKRGV